MLSRTLITYSSLFIQEIDRNGTRLFLESSPSYPNLLSVLQTLQYVGVNAQAGQCDWDYLKNLTTPFLMHLQKGNNQNLVIARWNSKTNYLETFDLNTKRWNIRKREHISVFWDGVVIYTTDALHTNHIRRIIYGILLFAFLSLIIFVTITTNNLYIELLYCLPVISGFIISSILYLKSGWEDLGIIDRFCHISKMTDCQRVDGSRYSYIFGLKLSSLALSYFLSQSICLVWSYPVGITTVIHSLYLISSVIFFPTIVYSAYGQFKLKRICPLCLIVALCIAIEATLFIILPHHRLAWESIKSFCLLFIIATIALSYIYNIRSNSANRLAESIDLLKLKRKKEVMLTESIPVKPLNSPIILGDKTSSTLITTIISPNCRHCQKMVADCISLQRKGLKFRWEIILGETSQKDSEAIDIWIKRFLDDKNNFFRELILWSNAKNTTLNVLDSFTNTATSDIRESFGKQIAGLNISGFPQLILDDRLLSSIYTVKDLEFLITDKNII